MKIKRGHIFTADLNPRFGTEAGKLRPVVIIQTDLINGEHLSTVICPLTSKVNPLVEILRVHLKKGESGLTVASDILIDQIRSIDHARLQKKIGELSRSKLKEMEEKINIILDLG